MWSSPTANWLASPDEKGLIADLNQAKLLWTSEDKACGGVRGQSRRYGGRVGMKPSAGGASPIVYRDKVYFYFLEPKKLRAIRCHPLTIHLPILRFKP